MLSTPAMQMAMKVNKAFGSMDQMQQRVMGGMQRGWQKVAGLFKSSTGEAAKLRKEIASLNAYRNFHFTVDSTEWVEAGKKIDELSAKLRHLKGATGGGSGGRGFFGKMATGMAAMSGGMLGALAMSGNPYLMAAGATGQMAQQAASSTIAPAMTRQMQEFQLGFQLGDQQAGKQLSNELKKLAIANPFLKSESAFQIAPALLTAGFKGTEIPEKLNMLTNLSVMAGRSIEDIAFQYKQIKMNGVAQQEELGQMADKLPVYKELIKLTGAKDTLAVKKMVTDGKITFDMVDKALGNIRGAKDIGQQAAGLSQAKFNMLTDQFQERLVSLGTRALPMVNKVLEYTSTTLDRISAYGEPIFRLAGAFSPLFESFAGLLRALGLLDEKNVISAKYVAMMSAAVDVLGKVVYGISWVIGKVVDAISFLVGYLTELPLFKFLGGAFGQMAKQQEFHNSIADRRAERNLSGNGAAGSQSTPSKSLGDAAGLSSTVEGARKQTTIINIGKFLDKIEMHVANLNEGVSMTETQLMDMMLRIANSAATVS